MVVQQYKKVTNYAPNSERKKDKAIGFIELRRRHTFLLQFEAGELFLSAQFSFVFSSIRFLSLVVTQIFTLLIVDTTLHPLPVLTFAIYVLFLISPYCQY